MAASVSSRKYCNENKASIRNSNPPYRAIGGEDFLRVRLLKVGSNNSHIRLLNADLIEEEQAERQQP